LMDQTVDWWCLSFLSSLIGCQPQWPQLTPRNSQSNTQPQEALPHEFLYHGLRIAGELCRSWTFFQRGCPHRNASGIVRICNWIFELEWCILSPHLGISRSQNFGALILVQGLRALHEWQFFRPEQCLSCNYQTVGEALRIDYL
jgi:hypothetical protein